MTTLVDGTVPVAADFNGNYTALNQVCGTTTAITGYTTGDLLYASAPTALSKLGIGSSGQTLTVSGGLPAWASSSNTPLDGTRGLKVVAHDPAQGTWVNGTTTYAAVASGYYNLFNGTTNDGHIVSDAAQYGAVGYFIKTKANPTTVVYEYWNGSIWTALTTAAVPAWNTEGYSALRFTVPGDWAVGGSGTGVPATSYNIRLRQTSGTVTLVGRGSLLNKVDITADEAILSTAGGSKARHASVSLLATDIRLASNVNGRDQAGAFGANSWVYLWITSDGVTPHGLWSTSATAPTLQGSDTYKVLIGGWRIDANSLITAMTQTRNRARLYAAIIDVTGRASGTDGTALTLTIPPEAINVRFNIRNSTAAGYQDFGPRPYTSTGQANTITSSEAKFGNAIIQNVIELDLEESQTIYTGTAGGAFDLYTLGWIFPGNLN